MKNIKIGLLFGALAGILDVIPMIFQGLSWDANLSAFSMWMIIGFFLATTSLKLNNIVKGILFSFLCLIPAGIIIAAQEPISLIPISIMTLILGSLLGYFIGRFKKLPNK
ncbi:hypothetical protein KJ903_05570 [Patescibacteria group bacterium]|nr:hypothetical protein [Patescibacteria group bacterium]